MISSPVKYSKKKKTKGKENSTTVKLETCSTYICFLCHCNDGLKKKRKGEGGENMQTMHITSKKK